MQFIFLVTASYTLGFLLKESLSLEGFGSIFVFLFMSEELVVQIHGMEQKHMIHFKVQKMLLPFS